MTTDLLSIEQAAPLIGLKPDSVRKLIHKGELRHLRIGPNRGLYRTTREWIAEYLQSCICDPKPSPQAPEPPKPRTRSVRREAVAPPQSQKERLKAFREQLKK